jgi:amino acid adenylation domain-containing protein
MSQETRKFADASELLTYLAKLDVQVSANNGGLALTAPKGVLTPHLQLELKSKKRELLEILREAEGRGRLATDVSAGKCIHDLFAAQAAATPGAVAVVCGASQLTYHDLDIRSNRLANRLRAFGVGPDALVGVCLDRSWEMVVALMAVLKAGGAYVPLDPMFPRDRLSFMLEDSGIAVLISRGDALSVSIPAQTQKIDLDRDWSGIERESADCPASGVTPENLAYVIYTSGSTGIPKGVAIPHCAVVNFLSSMRVEPGISPSDCLLAVTTLSFDIAALEIYLPLMAGARVVIAPQHMLGDGAALARLLKDSEATMMQATPITWRLLLDSGWDGAPRIKILCGGEALSRELANRLMATGGELWNLYGPTETTIWSTIHCVEAGEGAVPIGKAIADTQVYILNEHREPTPHGVAGELYIGGAGVAREYWKRPQLTVERFLPDPFRAGNRMYRTGDLVRRLPNGALEHLGRNDRQIKLRGFRIELGEIEAALEQQAGVRQAVVESMEFGPGDRRLTAYVVAAQPGDADRLRRALAATLPEHMVPAAYVFLDAFPLTPNNKVDRNRLPAPVPDAPAASAPAAASQGGTVNQLTDIWRTLLKTPAVELDDNFFSLGGHSLLILQLQNLIRRQFSREISVPDLFQRATIASQAELLDSHDAVAGLTNGMNVPAAVASSGIGGIAFRPAGNNGYAGKNGFLEPGRNGNGHQHLPPEASLSVSAADGADEAAFADNWRRMNQPGSRLVCAASMGSRRPLFLVAGFQDRDDTLMVLSRILSHLSADQPLYGLKPRWIDGGEMYAGVEEEAREYLTEIRLIQPHGPYLLGGYCVSGLVAFEMARQLLAEGEQIGLLALIDTERPTKVRDAALSMFFGMERAQGMAKAIRDAVRLSDPERSAPARERILRKLRLTGPATPEIAREKAYYQAKVQYRQMVREYTPTGYPGRITLLVNEQAYRADRHRGWDQIPVGELVIKKVSGDHITMFTEHGRELVDAIVESIDPAALQQGWRTEGVEVAAK